MNTLIYQTSVAALKPRLYPFIVILLGLFIFTLAPMITNPHPLFFVPYYFIWVSVFATYAGSQLADILSKPFSYCLPNKRETLGKIVTFSGLLYCLLAIVIYLILPEEKITYRSPINYIGLFLLGVTVYQAIVVTSLKSVTGAPSTMVNSIWFLVLFLLAYSQTAERIAQTVINWPVLSIMIFIASSALIEVFCSKPTTFRHIFGRTVYTFSSAIDSKRRNAVQDAYFRTKLRKPTPRQGLIPLLFDKFPRNILAQFVSEFYWRNKKNFWLYGFIVNTLLALWLFSTDKVSFRTGTEEPGETLAFVFLIYGFFPYVLQNQIIFTRRISPLLPISRYNHFKKNMTSAFITYVMSLTYLASIILFTNIVNRLASQDIFFKLGLFSTWPLGIAFLFASGAPVVCLIAITLRSGIGMALFGTMYSFFQMAVLIFYRENAPTDLSFVLIINLVAWICFTAQNYYRSLKSDVWV